MRALSMMEFKNLFDDVKSVTFVYDTSNQPNGMCEDIKIVSRYSEMICMLNPNRICFKNDSNTICFDRVKTIRYHDGECCVGNIFSIVCGNTTNNKDDKTCIIIADCTNLKSKLNN